MDIFFYSTRLIRTMKHWQTKLVTESKKAQQNLARDLFSLLTGFVLSNTMFGGVLLLVKDKLPSYLVIGCVIFLAELVTSQTYSRLSRLKNAPSVFLIWRIMNLGKLGLFFGFFVDAYKVGS